VTGRVGAARHFKVLFCLALATCSIALGACSGGTPSSLSPTKPTGSPLSGWTSAEVRAAKNACEQGGGTSNQCDCAVVYLETHFAGGAGSENQQTELDSAARSCAKSSPVTTTTLPTSTTTSSPYSCQFTLGTPSGTDYVAPGDTVSAYLESTDRDATVTGSVNFTGNGSLPNNDVPLTTYGPSSTDDGGRATYSFVIDPRDLVGAQMLINASVGGANCTASATVS
jgi:hypothetical protein